MSYLIRTKSLLNELQYYAQNDNKTDMLEMFLMQHLLIVFSSEIEAVLLDILRDFLLFNANETIKNFLRIRNNKLHNGIKQSNLADLLKSFSEDKKIKFNSLITDEISNKYGNYLKERDNVAHQNGQGISLSLKDVQDIVAIGEIIIANFKQSLEYEVHHKEENI